MTRFTSPITAAVLAALLLILSVRPSIAAPALMQLQIGTQPIRLPVPAGFAETSRRSKELWNQALALSAGDGRIVAHFVTEKDLADFTSGAEVVFREFLLVQTPRRAEALTVTRAQFDKLRSGTIALQSELSKRLEPRLSAEVERISKELSSFQGTSLTFRVGEIVPVSVDMNEPRTLIYTILSQMSTKEGVTTTNQAMVSTVAYCFVAGKVVMLVAYRHFRSPNDLQISRAFVTQWASSLLSAN